jgi:hypothetical protein
MMMKTELITLHVFDLLELLGTDMGDGGSMTLKNGAGEEMEVDLDNLCMVIRVDSPLGEQEGDSVSVPFSRN